MAELSVHPVPSPTQLNVGDRATGYTDEMLLRMWLHGKSDNTREAYQRDVAQFLAFAATPLQAVTLPALQAWADDLVLRGLSRATRARKLAAVKSLFSFGHRLGYIAFNVGAAVSTPNVHDTLADRILPESEIRRILSVETELRNGVLLRLFYASGGRVSELSMLRWAQLTERASPRSQAVTGQISLTGKGDKTRHVLLPADTWRVLSELRAAAHTEGHGRPEDPVFRSKKGGCLSRQQIWRIVKQAALRAGLNSAVSPHWFRHAHASHALDRGAPTHLVKETLGHKSLATTSKYTHARPDDSSANYLNV